MLSLIFHLNVAKKEPKDERLHIAVHTINNNIHNANPLDKSSNKAQPKQHCFITWGLIWDLKNENRRSAGLN